MALNIDTTSQKYQDYLTGLTNLRTEMLPRFKAFKQLSKLRQRWWLQRDPLMRKLVKMALIINKHIQAKNFVGDVEND